MNFQAIWEHFQSIVIVPSIFFHSFPRVTRKPGISSEDTSLIGAIPSALYVPVLNTSLPLLYEVATLRKISLPTVRYYELYGVTFVLRNDLAT